MMGSKAFDGFDFEKDYDNSGYKQTIEDFQLVRLSDKYPYEYRRLNSIKEKIRDIEKQIGQKNLELDNTLYKDSK